MGLTGHIYLVTMRAQRLGATDAIQNVFCYKQLSGNADASDLNDAWIGAIGSPLAAVLSQATEFLDLYTVNLMDVADFATTTLAGTGTRTVDPMPPFVAWEFEYVRLTRATNNGRKSFGYVDEGDVDNGVAAAGITAALTTLENALKANLVDVSPGGSWAPGIYRRPGTYASGVVSAPGEWHAIADVRYKAVSTQSTRKFGRGI